MPRSNWPVAARRRARDRAFALAAAPVLAEPQRFSRLRVERVKAGLTARELADAASLSSKAIYLIESGKSPATRLSRERIAGAIGAPVNELWPRVQS